MKPQQKPYPIDLLFRALADPTRLRLLNLMADNEICVCYLVEILGISQPKVSRHLAYLRRAGIAATRRHGKWMHYRLVPPGDIAASAILKETLSHLRQRPDLQRDLAKLSVTSCSPDLVDLQVNAPRPSAAEMPAK